MAGESDPACNGGGNPSEGVELTSSSQSPRPAPRRSTRVRSRPKALFDPAPSARDSPPVVDRLEQISYYSPAQLGIPTDDPAGSVHVRLHPVAAMLMSLHAHLTRMEIIGYLGGTVCNPEDAPGETHIVIAEAFAARAVGDRALARSGRSAYREVEIDPESSVEVMAMIQSKGLEVVGWYHSHPDASFTVEPSRVDIENQNNYQRHIFREKPFAAAIIAPYNEELPDFNPALEFFRVHEGEYPLRLPYRVDTLASIPREVLPEYWPADGSSRRYFPLLELEQECFALIDEHKNSAKRMRLGQEWRDPYTYVDKLRGALLSISEHFGGPRIVNGVPLANHGSASTSNGQSSDERSESQVSRFLDCVQRVVDHAAKEYAASAETEEEAREARRERKKARKGRRR